MTQRRVRVQASDRIAGIGAGLTLPEGGHWRPRWIVEKYADAEAYRHGRPDEVLEVLGNKLLDEGIDELFDLLCGAAATAYSNANAYIGVGDGGLTAISGTSVTFTNGSATVTGDGTSFSSQLAAGDWIQLDADGVLYRVESIEGNESLTLEHVYAETGGTGAGSFLSPTETGLAAASNKLYQGMDDGYPTSGSDQKATWRATFGASEANFQWNEITVANGDSDSADNLNRLVQNVGTKASPGVWTVSLEVSLY